MKLSDSGNPVSNKQITDLEEKISAKLPEKYVHFLFLNNGGYVDGFLVTPTFIETDPESHEKYYQSSNIDKFYEENSISIENNLVIDDKMSTTILKKESIDETINRIADNRITCLFKKNSKLAEILLSIDNYCSNSLSIFKFYRCRFF